MPEEAQEPPRRTIPQPIEQEMERSYIDYAMSVIVGRALPDVRDGLKPVQRRILHTMNETGASSTSQWRKAARVVGDCLGRYHPHGDLAIYDALARMVQDFSLRYPLVQGQGNWGSTEDEPAAMRYTECRLSKVAEEILQDIEKDSVEWTDNFDGTMREPLVLPAKFPNLLVNGSSGIAVGMATNIPPHNLREIVDALIVLIGNPSADLPDLYNPDAGPIRGPDFPTGGMLYGAEGVTDAYKTGRGLIRIRATAKFEEAGRDKARIVITEIPYMVNKAALVESIALLVKSKKIEGVVDLRDDVIRLIRHARDAAAAESSIISRYLLSEPQAKAILAMALRQLTGLEIEKLRRELIDLKKQIEDLEGILASRERILEIIKAELLEVKEKYGDDRRTAVEAEAYEMEIEDLIPEEDVVVTITNTGYIKRVPPQMYRTQRHGGKGVTGMETKEEDFVVNLFTASTHDYILFFSSKGQCYWLKTYKIPGGSRYAKGKPIVNLLPRLASDERVLDMIAVREFDPGRSIVFSTRLGKIKQTRLDAFKRPNIRGIRAIALNPSDELVEAGIADGDEEVILASAGGYANRFNLKEVRPMGRTAAGVRGMRLRKEDRVVSMALVKSEETTLLTVLESGFGKRTKVKEYRKTRRGSQGVVTTNMRVAKSAVVMVLEVEPGDELLVTTVGGIVIRCPADGIRETGRAARGVRIQRLNEGDKVTAVVRLLRAGEGGERAGETAAPVWAAPRGGAPTVAGVPRN